MTLSATDVVVLMDRLWKVNKPVVDARYLTEISLPSNPPPESQTPRGVALSAGAGQENHHFLAHFVNPLLLAGLTLLTQLCSQSPHEL